MNKLLRGKLTSLKDKLVLQADEESEELRPKRKKLIKQVKKVVLSTNKKKKHGKNKRK